MRSMTASEAVWYALAHLHRENPDQGAFDKHRIARKARELGYWTRKDQTLFQHLVQWVNAQSSSESARAAYVVGEDRGGPYRLVRPWDPVAGRRRDLPRHPEPGDDPDLQRAVQWYTTTYAKRPIRPARPTRRIEVDAETAGVVHAYALAHGLDDATTAALLIKKGLGQAFQNDPMLGLIGAAEGDDTTGHDHDEALYG